MKAREYFRYLTIGFIFSLLYTIAYRFWLIDIPGFIPKAHIIGELSDLITTGYIVSYVFYIFVEYFPAKIRNLETDEHISIYIKIIVLTMNDILMHPLRLDKRFNGIELFTIDEQEYSDLIKNIDYFETEKSLGTSYIGRKINIWQGVNYLVVLLRQVQCVNKNIERILSYKTIDEELYEILVTIRTCMFHEMVEEFNSFPYENDNIQKKINISFHDYWEDMLLYKALYIGLIKYSEKKKIDLTEIKNILHKSQ